MSKGGPRRDLKSDIDRLIDHYSQSGQAHGVIAVNASLYDIERAVGRKANQYRLIIYRGEALRATGPHGDQRGEQT